MVCYEVAEQRVAKHTDYQAPVQSLVCVPTKPQVKLLVTTPMILSGYLYWGGVLQHGGRDGGHGGGLVKY